MNYSLHEQQNKLPENRESAQRDSGGTQIIPAPIVSLARHDSKHSMSSLIWHPGTAGHRELEPPSEAGMMKNFAKIRKDDNVPAKSNLSTRVHGGNGVVYPKNIPGNLVPSTRNKYLNYQTAYSTNMGNLNNIRFLDNTTACQNDVTEIKNQIDPNMGIAPESAETFVPNPLSDPAQPTRSPKHRTTYSASSIKIHSTPINPHIAANPVHRQDFIRKSCDLQRELKLKIQERFGVESVHDENLLPSLVNVDEIKHDSLPSDGKHDDYLAID